MAQYCKVVTPGGGYSITYISFNQTSGLSMIRQQIPRVLIQPGSCRQGRSQQRALFVVHTGVDHFEYRAVIRETWGSASVLEGINARLLFVVGKSQDPAVERALKWEAEYHMDILKGGGYTHCRNSEVLSSTGCNSLGLIYHW